MTTSVTAPSAGVVGQLAGSPARPDPTDAESTAGETEARPARHGEYDEYEPLFRQMQDIPAGDPRREELRERLIAAHLPVAEHIAQVYRHRGEPSQDLRQVATIGLINAVDRYEPQYGRGFLPFAIPTIRGELQRHFRDSTWTLRVPRRLKELRQTLNEAATELTELLGRSPRPSELAEHLGLSTEEVYEGLSASAAYRPESLNRSLGQGDTDTELGELIGDADHEFTTVENHAVLRRALSQLAPREQRIVALRFFHDMTQSQIAQAVGVSQMHVSRLLAASLARLRAALTEHQPS
ncbi:SigB/SigF/SigG family RNA polymerase sigma factor [Thermocrispum sp.]|uniref:SigB/SigF/SigG family RNA polymerase sigma factor n=1 Tax=Thermocrispum sp. TaxID=2060768 RepID=UPI002580E7EC|nr:SigB/SigF/SigG family RNA polymerase sigma factor [Thermocrispum sp.]